MIRYLYVIIIEFDITKNNTKFYSNKAEHPSIGKNKKRNVRTKYWN
jgi:hypothetical protein